MTLVRCPDSHTSLCPAASNQPFLWHLAATRRPAWGAKKVGEKLGFSPSANGGVTYRFASYFGFMPK